MRSIRYASATLAVAAAATVAWYGLELHKAPVTVRAPASVVGRKPPSLLSASAVHPSTSEASKTSAVRLRDYAKLFREAGNYRKFVLDTLPAARMGDRDAQYHVHAALAYCDETNRFYFQLRGRKLSMDEAIAARSDLPGPSMAEAIRRAYGRCHEIHEIQNPDWGTPQEWLAKATEGGQPLAQMETARKIFLRPVTHGGVGIKEDGPAIAQGTYTEARALVRAAIESKNPQAIFNMGDLQGFLKTNVPGDQLAKDALTWRYAACLRGLDCGVDAEWYRQFCLWDASCQPAETGVDYLRRTAPGLRVFDLEERALDLSAKLDAGDWASLGIGELE